MKRDLKISIVTPNLNGALYLEETIKSILQQNYENLEYIIIDGGSTDDSISIIKKYESKIAKWVSEKDEGMYDALTKGLKMCTGDVIGYLNSDDIYVRGAFSAVNNIFSSNPNINWIHGQPTYINQDNNLFIYETIKYPKWSLYNVLDGDYKYIQQESVFWSRKLMDKVDLDVLKNHIHYRNLPNLMRIIVCYPKIRSYFSVSFKFCFQSFYYSLSKLLK